MYKKLRIVFTILSAICLALAIPLGMLFDFVGWIATLLGAGIFFLLMLLCKQSQEFAETKQGKSLKTVVPSDGDGQEGQTESKGCLTAQNAAEKRDDDGQKVADDSKNVPSPSSATAPVKKTRRYRRNKT